MFKVEDGTGFADANAYVSVSDAQAYHSLRNNKFSGTDAEISALLIKASEYIDMKYSFAGSKTNDAQAMQFPRKNIAGLDSDVIPSNLIKAVMEVALKLKTTDLFAAVSPAIKRVKVDVIETEYFGDEDTANTSRAMPFIDNLLKAYSSDNTATSGSGFNVSVTRVA